MTGGKMSSRTAPRLSLKEQANFFRIWVLPGALIALTVAVNAKAFFMAGARFGEDMTVQILSGLLVAIVFDGRRREGSRRRRELSVKFICDRIRKAKSHVRLVDIWLKNLLVNESDRKAFRSAVETACADGVKVQIIVAAPECDGTAKRAETLARNADEFSTQTAADIIESMHRGVGHLYALNETVAEEVEARGGKHLEVRIALNAPDFQIYQIDKMVYWGFYEADRTSLNSPQNVHKLTGDSLSHFFNWYLDDIIKNPMCISLDEYYEALDQSKNSGTTLASCVKPKFI